MLNNQQACSLTIKWCFPKAKFRSSSPSPDAIWMQTAAACHSGRSTLVGCQAAERGAGSSPFEPHRKLICTVLSGLLFSSHSCTGNHVFWKSKAERANWSAQCAGPSYTQHPLFCNQGFSRKCRTSLPKGFKNLCHKMLVFLSLF